jgi:hypothetical protein
MTTEKQITSIKIDDDLNGVKIGFGHSILMKSESIEEEAETLSTQYQVKAKLRPHKDFVDAMKSLRKHGFEICEMTVDAKEIKQWTVLGFKIAGDMLLHKSRVVLEMGKKVDRTNKIIKFKTPQVNMFPEADEESRFHDAEKLTGLIESVIEEAWAYLNGKFEDTDLQMKLFETNQKLETNFVR